MREGNTRLGMTRQWPRAMGPTSMNARAVSLSRSLKLEAEAGIDSVECVERGAMGTGTCHGISPVERVLDEMGWNGAWEEGRTLDDLAEDAAAGWCGERGE